MWFMAAVTGGLSLVGAVFLVELPLEEQPAFAPPDDASDELSTLLPPNAGNVSKEAEVSLLNLVRTLDFWLLFGIFGLVAGAGFVVFNQLGEVWLSLGGESGGQRSTVLVLSVMNCAGRLVAGFASDFFARSRNLPRAWWIVLSCGLMAVAHFSLVVVSTPEALLPGVMIAGFAYGGLMASTPTVMGDSFGKTHFGANWAAIRAAPAGGSALLASGLASGVYRANQDSDLQSCSGKKCFLWTFAACCIMCALCSILAIWLTIRLRRRRRLTGAVEVVTDLEGDTVS
jgi:Major Facilitator Superfamily